MNLALLLALLIEQYSYLPANIIIRPSNIFNCINIFRENNKHFLVDCPLFINERAMMFNNLNELEFQPTIRNLLYGNTEHSEQVNIKAFLVIQNYISATGRF